MGRRSPDPRMPLFHWAPMDRRKQIIRHGLRPSMRGTTSADPQWRAPHVCFAESPSWAWALSGYFSPHIERWDLWQTYYGNLADPKVIKTYDGEHIFHEVRTKHRVYKSALWFVGERPAQAMTRRVCAEHGCPELTTTTHARHHLAPVQPPSAFSAAMI